MEGRYGFHWPMQTNNQQHGPKRPRGRRCEDLCLLLRAVNSCRVPGTELTSSHAMTVKQHTLYSVALVCFFLIMVTKHLYQRSSRKDALFWLMVSKCSVHHEPWQAWQARKQSKTRNRQGYILPRSHSSM